MMKISERARLIGAGMGLTKPPEPEIIEVEKVVVKRPMKTKAASISLRPPDKQTMIDGKQASWYISPYQVSRYSANDSTYINDGYAGNSDIYSIISYANMAASGIRWYATKKVGDNDVPLEDYHPVARYLQYPNPLQSMREYVQNWYGYKLLLGNTYEYFQRPENGVNAGKVIQGTVLPANYVEVVVDTHTGAVTGYKLNQHTPPIPVEDISHSRYWNPQVDRDGIHYGLSPLAAGLRLLSMSNSGYDASTSSMQSGGVKGILSANAEDQWTGEGTSRVQNAFDRDAMGVDNYGKVMVTSARLTWQAMGVSPADLELLDALKLTFRQLCSMYRFPSLLLNDKDGSMFNTYREAKKGLYTDLILPDMMPLKDSLQRNVADPWNQGIQIHYDTSSIEVLQDDKAAQASWLSQAWWVRVTDKQRMMGLPVDDKLDMYLVPSGLVPIDDLTIDLSDEMKGLSLFNKT